MASLPSSVRRDWTAFSQTGSFLRKHQQRSHCIFIASGKETKQPGPLSAETPPWAHSAWFPPFSESRPANEAAFLSGRIAFCYFGKRYREALIGFGFGFESVCFRASEHPVQPLCVGVRPFLRGGGKESWSQSPRAGRRAPSGAGLPQPLSRCPLLLRRGGQTGAPSARTWRAPGRGHQLRPRLLRDEDQQTPGLLQLV